MVNQGVIKAKINHIENNLQRLEEKQHIDLVEFLNSVDMQDIVLHNLQLSIQGCIDLASHIISDEGWTIPNTLAELFEILKNKKIISVELNKRLKKMVGFRNIIIHEYGNLDLKKIHSILSQDIKDIRQFLKQICIFVGI